MTIKKVQDTMTQSLKNVHEAFGDIPSQAYQYFKSKTPKRSGNARRNTKLKGDVISADYDYAQRLDQGYSKKAPQGMTDPTLAYVRKLGDQAIRK